MAKRSAGLLLYRRRDELEVLLAHPGGPFFAKKDAGAWTVFKGELDEGEDPWACARREFEEESGHPAPDAVPLDLGEIKQKGGKVVRAFAVPGDFDPNTLSSNTFEMAWPPRSGKIQSFPEVDRAAWFSLGAAADKINPAQVPFLDRLRERVDVDDG